MPYFGLTLYLYLVSNYFTCEAITVHINDGLVRGSFLKTRDNRNVYSFRGIPYAEPPIGDRRFKPAIPKKAWHGILDATDDAPMCPQSDFLKYPISEDCLFLNVYTRNFSARQPVMVFLHFGSLILGTGRSDLFGPQYLLERDIVLVTLNHRLGILGFIATDTADAPGNLGFKDQVLALKWVRDNIAHFGGNPQLVTLFGHGGGALSCGAQLISPMSKGLFHRAILMSNSPTELTPPMNYRQTRVIADYIGCSRNKSIVECLRRQSLNKLLESSERLNEFAGYPVRKWNVVVERDFGQDRFMIEDPNEAMIKGRFHRVPIMGGWVAGEFVRYAHDILHNPVWQKSINEDRYTTNPITLLYTQSGEKSRYITDRLRQHYLGGANFTKQSFEEMGILWGDAIIRFRMRKFLQRAKNYQDVYIYSISYIGRYSQFYYPDKKPYTVAHADDVQYIFYSKNGFGPLFTKEDKENFMVERMMDFLTTFAKEGIPSTNTDDNWVPSNRSFEQIYELSGDQGPKKFQSFIGIWYELFPGP